MTSRASRASPAPIKAAHDWMAGMRFSPDRPLIDVSQAAPSDAPPEALRTAMADYVLHEKEAHLYGPILGMLRLRRAMATHCSQIYHTTLAEENIAITSGCNQAFCATISALSEEGDEVILATPWYFNHKMWLDMMGVQTRPLACGSDMMPDPEQAERLITPKTRAICLVSPNNPAGVAYPDALLHAFFDLAQTHGIVLILDETYKDFHPDPTHPHSLCQRENAHDTLVQLFSFSKSFRLTGHRVGAIVTASKRLQDVEKFLDTVTICPSQVGQYGAYWGLLHLSDWLDSQRKEMSKRRAFLEDRFSLLSDQGWKLLGVGGYFAYVEHPFELSSDKIAEMILRDSSILCLPGTMFAPPEMVSATRQLRIAFANIGCEELEILIQRLHKFSLALASTHADK